MDIQTERRSARGTYFPVSAVWNTINRLFICSDSKRSYFFLAKRSFCVQFPQWFYIVSANVNVSKASSGWGWQNTFAEGKCTALLGIGLMLLWGASCVPSAWCWLGIESPDLQNWEDRPAEFSVESMEATTGMHFSGLRPALNITRGFTTLSPSESNIQMV